MSKKATAQTSAPTQPKPPWPCRHQAPPPCHPAVAAIAAIPARVPGLRKAALLCKAPATARELSARCTARDCRLALRLGPDTLLPPLLLNAVLPPPREIAPAVDRGAVTLPLKCRPLPPLKCCTPPPSKCRMPPPPKCAPPPRIPPPKWAPPPPPPRIPPPPKCAPPPPPKCAPPPPPKCAPPPPPKCAPPPPPKCAPPP